jgi:hypothetical protein
VHLVGLGKKMGKFVILSGNEQYQLIELVGRHPMLVALAEHYAKVKSSYDKWADELSKPVDFAGEKMLLSESAVQNQLITRIEELDGKLYGLTRQQEAKNKGIDHGNCCKLFARNSLAQNPILPGDSS